MYAPHGVAFAKQCSSDRGGTAHASCLSACQRMRVCPTFRSAAVGITALSSVHNIPGNGAV